LSQLKVLRALAACRTAALGGHLDTCDTCGFERPAYNSCRNRHCPKCQSLAKADWLKAREAELLPVGYFHNVFAPPHELEALTLNNPEIIYNLLFQSVSETLLAFGRDPNRLDGRMGFSAILHTWDQLLRYHVHLHVVIPGGALSCDGRRWNPARPDFLFPVKALGKTFRGKFIAGLGKAHAAGKLAFPGELASIQSPDRFEQFLRPLRRKPWIVYSKRPFRGPGKALDYLGRYTHRVAVSNHRILDVQDGKVAFSYRDRRDNGKKKIARIEAHEFIRRFLLHVVPDGFMRIRHYGFLANSCKKQALAKCRQLLGQPPEAPQTPEKTTAQKMLELTGRDITLCPACRRGTLRTVTQLSPHELVFLSTRNPQVVLIDTS
jgi:hypothetical protein